MRLIKIYGKVNNIIFIEVIYYYQFIMKKHFFNIKVQIG